MNNLGEIILLAIISIFLGLKLFSILGQKRERPPHENKGRNHLDNDAENEEVDGDNPEESNNLEDRIKEVEIKTPANLTPQAKLEMIDPSFHLKTFLSNATDAFKMILDLYVKGDTHALSDLINIEMMRKFAYEISNREDKGYTCEINILNVKNSSIQNIEIEGSVAKISVQFDYEAIAYVYDKKSKIISGHKSKVEKNKDVWTFSRNLRSPDPTWQLIYLSHLFA